MFSTNQQENLAAVYINAILGAIDGIRIRKLGAPHCTL